ncbi:Krr1-domain-containing protein [Cylindrobasidium torrendii FP15055 ss-10]|uniref:Krr1-domain-containing protein n=1 Tax=Cylindrobasidium torrendii FP15055 ss-10 TaxID=1314674 RepID=A0A0D7AYU6_9AGAR|nr:Krr1-domain-containing protein [Cylindrobasidium torrendii FP15055 ss-10]
MLSDSESDNGEAQKLTINEHYAKAFQYRKEREELEKLKAKYGSDYEEGEEEEEEDSESDESEDEDGEELTPAVDAAILRTLARIKQKDPGIYASEKNIFTEEQSRVSTAKPRTKAPKEAKPITMRQVRLESALNATSRSPSPEPELTHVQEQQKLRDETIAAFQANSDDEDDDLLVPRGKTKDEVEREEDEYRAFLEREVGKDLESLITVQQPAVLAEEEEAPQSANDKGKNKKDKKKKDVSTKTKDQENQEFLMRHVDLPVDHDLAYHFRSYIFNRGWIDQSERRIPTYSEVTSSKKATGKAADTGSEADDEEAQRPTIYSDVDEEDFEDTVDRFEASYNYRFEEPDALEIKSYPRNLPSLVRREDTTRKDARQRKKERKAAEMQEKKEEIRRLKALKMKDIRAKLDKIAHEGGKLFDNDPELRELDLDADWDPDAHDAQMAGLYGDDGELDDDEKPVWADDIDIGDIPFDDNEEKQQSKKKKKKKGKKKAEAEQDGVDLDAMDADVERNPDDEEWDGTEEMRKRKLDEYMDELYELDFNDLVAGQPTKFRYANVPAQNFGLTPAEILMATDAELNQFMSVKKYAPYRKDSHAWDSQRNEKIKELKNQIHERMGGDEKMVSAVLDKPAKKRKGKKERQRAKEEGGEDAPSTEAPSRKRKLEEAVQVEESHDSSKKKKRRHKKKAGDE